ncbi:hypothetical protein [Chitinophaga rhizosphaerae]|uniref:hypothetical protein n=1 Tax=Chitinophaga rhizosphaerae TaxID=1864947 RepID=UPI000F8043C0|nr:hypothetical protein [Chitinophaga rhizosphaerae]
MEQHENKESFYHLDLVCRYIAGNFGNPEIASWTNGDYLRLSGILSRASEIQLSPSTLKRIFGKLKTTERYYPQKATRDGLARYAGFADWDDFVDKHPRPAKPGEAAATEAPGPLTKLPQPKAPRISWWPALILMAGACAIFGWQWLKHMNRPPERPAGAKLVCSNPVGDNPHSAVFRVQLPDRFRGDSSKFIIAFGDGERDLPISPGAVLTHYYEKPGRFYAKLLYDSRPVDTVPIYLKTNGWTATATSQLDTTRVYPLETPAFGAAGMSATPKEVYATGVDTLHTFYVDFVNTQEWDATGDDIELTARLATSRLRPGIRCSQVMITLYGEKSQHEMLLLKPGCVSWAYLVFAEKGIHGSRTDLSPVGTDLSSGGTVHLRVKDKHAWLTVNGKRLYDIAYNEPVGKLYGIRFNFAGIGSIQHVSLKKPGGTVVFEDGEK